MPQIKSFEDFDYLSRCHIRRPRGALRDHEDRNQESGAGRKHNEPLARPQNPDGVVFGDVLQIPDAIWGFVTIGRVHDTHPGVCIKQASEEENKVQFLQGRGAENINPYYRSEYVLFEASESSGLTKLTAFRLELKLLRFHKVRSLYPQQRLGRFDTGERNRIDNIYGRVLGVMI